MKVAVTLILVLVVAAVIVWFQFQAQQKLRDENQALQQAVAGLSAANLDLSNRLSAIVADGKLAEDQQNELLRLRGEVASLRRRTNQLAQPAPPTAPVPTDHRTSQDRTPPDQDALDQQNENNRAKVNDARYLALALIKYAGDHQSQISSEINDVQPYLDRNFTGTNRFELAYHGNRDAIGDPSMTILVAEESARQMLDGRWAKTYGFADGHAEVHVEADGDFETWEHRHMIQPDQ